MITERHGSPIGKGALWGLGAGAVFGAVFAATGDDDGDGSCGPTGFWMLVGAGLFGAIGAGAGAVNEFWTPVFSPDGRKLAFGAERPDGKHRVGIIDFGQGTTVIDERSVTWGPEVLGWDAPCWSPDSAHVVYVASRWNNEAAADSRGRSRRRLRRAGQRQAVVEGRAASVVRGVDRLAVKGGVQ